ncbi:MAG: thiamine pyrophosphate-dependent dehydrogenase E1 component subunit alpha [Nitrospira sp.]|nr:thiamine pyrophosphate-dependent dehydrogenase E1 component subunit alpha [Nitrospira sp.]
MKSEFTAEFLSDLYRQMVTIRFFEESLVAPILNSEIRTPCHLSCGQEAIAVGLCSGLSRDDYVFGSHRSHGHYLAKGGDLRAMMAEIYCKATGCSRGRGGSMHVIDQDVGMMGSAPIVAGTVSLAVGAALAAQIRQDGRVVVSFFGDGACGEGVLYESLNFAALKRLPVIFACENNLYSTHLPIRECRVSQPIYMTAASFGIESHQVDGNDLLQVLGAGRNAVEACRKGNGPVFLELMTYRLRGHVGPDDAIQGTHQDIRPQHEIEAWRKRDPITCFERYLLAGQLVDEHTMASIRADVAAGIGKARDYAMESPSPRREELLRYVFA